MVFTIEEINNSKELLPGIKLGYQIHDSCGSVPLSMQVTFQLSNGLDRVIYTSSNCSHSGMVMAIVGESSSTRSISMSHVIGPFKIPQVNIFNFFKTVVSIGYKPVLTFVFPVKELHLFLFRWATLPLVHACLISSGTQVSSERSLVTNFRQKHWPSWWNTLAGLG